VVSGGSRVVPGQPLHDAELVERGGLAKPVAEVSVRGPRRADAPIHDHVPGITSQSER
jgi:hypothetical protein